MVCFTCDTRLRRPWLLHEARLLAPRSLSGLELLHSSLLAGASVISAIFIHIFIKNTQYNRIGRISQCQNYPEHLHCGSVNPGTPRPGVLRCCINGVLSRVVLVNLWFTWVVLLTVLPLFLADVQKTVDKSTQFAIIIA